MIIIIHGDDIVNSRKKIDEYISGSTIRIDFAKEKLVSFEEKIRTNNLFGESKIFLLENLSALRKNELEMFLNLVEEYKKNAQAKIIIWVGEVADKRLLSKFEGSEVLLFTLPKHYYNFVDSITPENGKLLRATLYKLYPETSAEQVFYSLSKRVRMLLIVKAGNTTDFEEFKTVAPWQLTKLTRQAGAWDEKKLLNFYSKLFDLELKMKTGDLAGDLINHIDICLVSELN